ncbi:MAG TPA: PTPA-CTERM sorting domain-containing protein [Leptolyngbyaceae cyanobacterium]
MNNQKLWGVLGAVAATATVVATAMPSQAASFSFQFDDTFDFTLTDPIVGTGTFSFDSDLGDGSYALTSLPNYLFSFNIDGHVFGNIDIVTPLSEIFVEILDSGKRVAFSNINPIGSGPFAGAIDFISSNNKGLSFEPPGLRPGQTPTLYQLSGLSISPVFGTYVGTSTPTPEPIPEPTPVLLPYLIAMGVAALRKKGKQEPVEQEA